jgi:RNA polymerase sigma factor (sigma-70 family)
MHTRYACVKSAPDARSTEQSATLPGSHASFGGMEIAEVGHRTMPVDQQQVLERALSASWDRLLALCASLVGWSDAEDVMQDLYSVSSRRATQLRDPAAAEAWLRRIAVNLCYPHHRRRSRFIFGRVPDRQDSTVGRDVGLRELIEELPSRERTVLVLHYGHGYRLEEIAELLSLSHTNVRSIIARSRKKLHRQWIGSDR